MEHWVRLGQRYSREKKISLYLWRNQLLKPQNHACFKYVTPIETGRRSTYFIKPASSVMHSLCYHFPMFVYCLLFVYRFKAKTEKIKKGMK